MKQIIIFFQIISAIILIVLVLIQSKSSLGLVGGVVFERRGLEKKIYWLTWILGFVFIFLTLMNIFFQ